MGCSSCGGGGVVSGSPAGASGVQARNGVPVRYVWRWTANDGGEVKDFPSEGEARAWQKIGNAGSLMVVPG